MSGFDQRGQKVGKQTNISGDQYTAGRDIHRVEGDVVYGDKIAGDKIAGDKIAGDKVAGDKNVYVAIGAELQGLVQQVQEAAQTGDLDGDTALDAEHSLKKAELEADKPQPDKTKLLGYLDTAKTLLDKAAAASKSAAALGAALGAAYAKIKGWL